MQKNREVSGHQVDLLLSCGCITTEEIEAVIFLPIPGQDRYCSKHKRDVTISRVGSPYWKDKDEADEA